MNGVQPLRIGVIGAGFVAQVAHLHSFSLLPGARILALAEPHDSLREAVADHYRVEKRTRDYREVLGDPDVDAVVISMPRFAQAAIVKEALEAKAAVLSEKPLAMTVAEGEELVAVAQDKKRTWAVGYMKRYDLGAVRFRELLMDARQDQRWGKILDVTVRDFCATYGSPVPPHVRRNGSRPFRFPEGAKAPEFVRPSQGRDYEYTINVMSHDINLLRWMFPGALSARAFTVRSGGVQQARFDADSFGITATVGPADLGFWDQRLEVTFERARLCLVLPSPMARQETSRTIIWYDDCREERVVPPAERRCAFEAQAHAFTEAAAMGLTPASGGVDGLADLTVIESLWRTVDWHQ
jgi:predicted dehydrogenase